MLFMLPRLKFHVIHIPTEFSNLSVNPKALFELSAIKVMKTL